MKRISIIFATIALCVASVARAQDAATKEQLDQLRGTIEDLKNNEEALNKKIAQLTADLNAVREKAGTPTGDYVTREEMNRLTASFERNLKDVDNARKNDNEAVKKTLTDIQRAVGSSSARGPISLPPPKKGPSLMTPPSSDQGFEYAIKKGDTLSAIIDAYRAEGISVTQEAILAANPGLKPTAMQIGTRIFIPAPAGTSAGTGISRTNTTPK